MFWILSKVDLNTQDFHFFFILNNYKYIEVLMYFNKHRIESENHNRLGVQQYQALDQIPIGIIVFMNVIFSFDSILSAMALASVKDESGMTTGYQTGIMTVAIVIGGLIMILLADKVTTFLQRNRMYEVLGLFVLFVVGIMLLTEGAHLAHLKFFGNPIHAMTKTTFYFVIGVLLLTDIVQARYQKKINAEKMRRAKVEG